MRIIVKLPTCAEPGIVEYTCIACGKPYTEQIAPTGHMWTSGKTVAPSCNADGYNAYVCKVCGKQQIYELLPARGHNFDGELIVDIQGITCGRDGWLREYYVCTNPGCEEQNIVTDDYWPPLDHQSMLDELVRIEVTENMTTEEKDAALRAMAAEVFAQAFTGADGEFYINVAPNGMQIPGAPEGCIGWVEDAKVEYLPASCTEDGLLCLSCTSDLCPACVEVTLPAPGHNWEIRYHVDATCTEWSKTVQFCTECDAFEVIEGKPLGHSCGENYAYKAPSCTEAGYKFYTCTVCQQTVKETIPAAGHTCGENYAYEEPTCTEDGFIVYGCTVCHQNVSEMIPAAGHTYDKDNYEYKEPTCTEAGMKIYTCTACHQAVIETIPAAGHTYDKDNYAYKAPGCTEAGMKIYTCTACHQAVIETIPAAGHTYDKDNYEYKEPSCTADGSISFICIDCRQVVIQKTPALGHTWERSDYVGNILLPEEYNTTGKPQYYDSYISATCQNGAQYVRTCSDPACPMYDAETGKSYTEILTVGEKTGHLPDSVIIDKSNLPTCTATGTAYFNCGICGKFCEMELPCLPHNPALVWNDEEERYEEVCIAAESANFDVILADYMYAEFLEASASMGADAEEYAQMRREAFMENLANKLYDGEFIRGIGCGKVLSETGGSTPVPTMEPQPTPEPTAVPTMEPKPTPEPTAVPTMEPQPTPEPTAVPTMEPQPTPDPHENAKLAAVYSDGVVRWNFGSMCDSYDVYFKEGTSFSTADKPLFTGWSEPSGSFEMEIDTSVTNTVVIKCQHKRLYYDFILPMNNVLTLPAGLTAVADEALTGVNADKIVVPASMRSIGSRAFADCKSLDLVVFEGGSCFISADAFEGNDSLVIFCPAGSDAEAFAKAGGFRYVTY